MATPANTNQTWRFGVFEVDAKRVELRRGGIPVRMRDQSFRILVYLLEHAGEIVTREELRQILWPSDTFVDFDHSLNTAVMKLREALGDSTGAPLYIETIPKRGYRFIAPLSQAADARNAIANVENVSTQSPHAVLPHLEELEVHRELANEVSKDWHRSPPVLATVPAAARRLWRTVALIAAAVAMLAIGAALWWRNQSRLPDRSQWVQITKFPDSVSQPALSPDGRMVAFIHGYSTWMGPARFT